MENMQPEKIARWSLWVGSLGVILFVVALVLLWQGGGAIVMDRFDHKDFYFAGSGLLYIAIWFKLAAIFLQRK